MNFIELLPTVGFPIACVAVLGYYVSKVQNENRQDTKEREERLLGHLQELSQTNRTLLETNAVLVKDINTKLDQIVANIKG